MSRPTASVIVPFAGPAAELPALVSQLQRLELGPGDELLVAHNAAAAGDRYELSGVPIVPAPRVQAPGYARNCAARVAAGQWLVFIDADTLPDAGLLAAYFSPPPRASTGILAGAIRDIPGGPGLAARHSLARGHMSQRVTLDREGSPYAQTANCAVRHEAFTAVGEFDESVVAGEDADLCFRLARAGWEWEERPGAQVQHRTRATLRGLLRQLSVHGAGAAWLDHRYPGEFPPMGTHQLAAFAARRSVAALGAAAHGQGQSAALALLDFITVAAFERGRRRSNLARSPIGVASPQPPPDRGQPQRDSEGAVPERRRRQ